MTVLDAVREAMGRWPEARASGDEVIVATHCVYPSNGVVRVRVTGGRNAFKVTDNRGAMDEMESSGGRTYQDIYTLRSLARPHGLFVADTGVVYSPVVSLDQLLVTILLVANVSKDGAAALVSKFSAVPKKNFREMVDLLIERERAQGRLLDVAHRRPIVGASKKAHKFDYDLLLPQSRRLLLDAVVPEASSINAVLAANIDVKEAEHSGLEQRIVYDDDDAWKAADLNLLALGATVIPFSRLRPVLEKLAA